MSYLVIGGALLVLCVILLAAMPWRARTRIDRLWMLASILNTLVFVAMPTTAATSSWRPVVGRVLFTTAIASFGLLVLGVILGRGAAARGAWTAPLLLAGLPAAFYGFFWMIGPLY